MPATIATVLSVFTPLLGLTAALTLFYRSLGFPPEKQSWKGTTPAEVLHRRKQWIMKWIGIPSAVLATAFQISLTIWRP
jgi:hypothetical protein